MAGEVIINPTFRLDVTGKLFRNKSTNQNLQDTLIFNQLMTRLSINKGDLPLFPTLGLKQFFGKFGYLDEAEADNVVMEFESEIEAQLGRTCTIEKVVDVANKHIDVHIEIDGLSVPLNLRYFNNNGSIRIIEPQFTD